MSCKSHGAGGFAGTCRMLEPGQRCGLIHEFCGSMTLSPSTTKWYSCTPAGTFGRVTDQTPCVSFVIAVSGPNCPVTFTSFAFGARKRKLTPPSFPSSGEISGGGCGRRACALVAGLVSCANATGANIISVEMRKRVNRFCMDGRVLLGRAGIVHRQNIIGQPVGQSAR